MSSRRDYLDEESFLEQEGAFPDYYYETENEDLRHKAHVRKLLEAQLDKKRLKKELNDWDDEFFDEEFDTE